MKFCMRHWNMMRAEVEARGMTPLISEGGESVVEKMVEELQTTEVTLETFDPLMAVHWNIVTNVLRMLGQNGLYLMSPGPEDPIEVDRLKDPALKEKYAGQSWPRCPLCYVNIAHEFSCSDPKCDIETVNGWDVTIGWAADAAKQHLDTLMKK